MIIDEEGLPRNKEILGEKSPSTGCLFGIDVGTKRIGIAVCDLASLIASPKQIIIRKSNQKDFEQIRVLADDYKPHGIVVGLPRFMNDSPHNMTIFVFNFVRNLDQFFKGELPIFLHDERMSSFEAREMARSPLSRKKGKEVDDIAASIILQRFLDEHRDLLLRR